MPTLRFRSLWLALGFGFVLLVIALSLAPPPPGLETDVFNPGHIVAYFWLMIWFAQIYRGNGARLQLALAFGVLGIALEFAQGLTGYRHFDYMDMVLNCIGIALALMLARTPLQDALQRLERAFVQ
jgi:VanZ family protein